MSVALALMALGRSVSFGRLFMAASIFSFTSIKAKSVFVPNSNSMRMMPSPSRVSLFISRNPDTCNNCRRNGATTVFSNSLAEEFSLETCMDICGMAISGSNDTGSVKYVTTPITKHAANAIITAIGRCNRNFTIRVCKKVSPFAYSQTYSLKFINLC